MMKQTNNKNNNLSSNVLLVIKTVSIILEIFLYVESKSKLRIENIFWFQADAGVLENEWKFAAMVLDRVCLIAFSFFTVLLSAAVLIAAPHVIVM